ncbi:Lrp/AsnC family transcriptional regulator [Nocardioides marmoraquaticus]
MEELDPLDRRLVGALHLRPRGSYDELGSVLGADPTTVARRLARLVDYDVVRVVGQVDWSMSSRTLPVHLFVETRGAAPGEVVAALRELPTVQYLAQVSGASAVFATVHAADEPATSAVLAQVHALSGVASVRTLPVLEALNRGAGWDPGLLGPDEVERCGGPDPSLALPSRDLPRGALDGPERQVVELLRADGRAASAAVGRATGLSASTAHRVVRRVLDRGWVRPRVEVDASLLGFTSPFVLQVTVRPGSVVAAAAQLAALPETRFTTRVAGRTSLLCTGLAADRTALARFIDERVSRLDGLRELEVDIVLAEERRYWTDRTPDGRLGPFVPPPLL